MNFPAILLVPFTLLYTCMCSNVCTASYWIKSKVIIRLDIRIYMYILVIWLKE